MPLDSHSYLVAQGWTGKGTALRQGAISRPLAIPQKRTLAGVGKDRDEAFPFWDHLFSAAAKSIQVKLLSDDEDSADTESNTAPAFKRTTTGILSNRRPVAGTPATTSGTNTPDADPPRLSLLATAKREAAKRNLYSRFFRGPVIGPDDGLQSDEEHVDVENTVNDTIDSKVEKTIVSAILADIETKEPEKKRKLEDNHGDDDERKERKRRKRELKEKKEGEKAKGKTEAKEKGGQDVIGKVKHKKKGEDDAGALDRAERRRRKREAKKAANVDTGDEERPDGRQKEKRREKRVKLSKDQEQSVAFAADSPASGGQFLNTKDNTSKVGIPEGSPEPPKKRKKRKNPPP